MPSTPIEKNQDVQGTQGEQAGSVVDAAAGAANAAASTPASTAAIDAASAASVVPQLPKRILTIPNLVSFARLILLLPLTMWLIITARSDWALLSVVVLGMTDWMDGFLARKLHQESELGRQMDPLADRLSIVLISLALVVGDLLQWQVLALIAVMDAVCAGAMLVLLHSTKLVLVSKIGKVRTFVLLVGLPLLLLADMTRMEGLFVAATWVMWLGALLHVLAEVGYIRSMFVTRVDLKAKGLL